MVAIGIAVFMPLGLLLGLTVPSAPSRAGGSTITQEPVANLIHLLPVGGYEEVPQADAVDRKGLMAERRDDYDRLLELVIPPAEPIDSVLLPDRAVQIQQEATSTQQALLPRSEADLFSLGIEVNPLAKPLWMYG